MGGRQGGHRGRGGGNEAPPRYGEHVFDRVVGGDESEEDDVGEVVGLGGERVYSDRGLRVVRGEGIVKSIV